MKRPVLSLLVCLALAACGGLDSAGRSRLQAAVDGLDTAVFNGNKTPEIVLGSYESLYKKYPQEPIAVGAYVDALRRVGQPKKAADVLKPFIEKTDSNKLPDDIFMPYMRLLVDQGFNEDAEKRLEKRLNLPSQRLTGVASKPQIQNLLGIALAGQNKKTQAEQMFTQALAHWDGRAGVVEKNIERLKAAETAGSKPGKKATK